MRVGGERRPERRGAQALHISNGEPLKKKSIIRLVFPGCNSGASMQEMRERGLRLVSGMAVGRRLHMTYEKRVCAKAVLGRWRGQGVFCRTDRTWSLDGLEG